MKAPYGSRIAMPQDFNLERFVEAQNPVIDEARRELADGRKRTHWIWFVFPQIAGLGHSSMAQRYAVGSLAEAEAYVAHPVLGPRLVECTQIVNDIQGRTAHQIFDSPDDMKFRSSMTLFASVPKSDPCFAAALDRYYNGERDGATLRLLKG